MFQSFYLIPNLTALENVEAPLKISKYTKTPSQIVSCFCTTSGGSEHPYAPPTKSIIWRTAATGCYRKGNRFFPHLLYWRMSPLVTWIVNLVMILWKFYKSFTTKENHFIDYMTQQLPTKRNALLKIADGKLVDLSV